MPEHKGLSSPRTAESANPFDPARLAIEPVSSRHKRDAFDCGEPELNDYLQHHAHQNHKKNIAKTFVAVDPNKRVLGYHALSSVSVEFEELPEAQRKHLPHYPIPATLIGRFAVDVSVQRKGLGERLLIDALQRIARTSQDVAVKLIIVDSKSERAKQFYLQYGFMEFTEGGMKLFLPIETAKQLLAAAAE